MTQHWTQPAFNQAARAFCQAWEALLQKAASRNSTKIAASLQDSNRHTVTSAQPTDVALGPAMLQSAWHIATATSVFGGGKDEVCYLTMPGLPLATSHQAPQVQASVQDHVQAGDDITDAYTSCTHADGACDLKTGDAAACPHLPSDHIAVLGAQNGIYRDYTSKEQRQHALTSGVSQIAGSTQASLCTEHASRQQDTAALTAPCSALHVYELHVLLHPTYQAPTLFLRGTTADGCCLSWQDVELDFPHWQQLRELFMGGVSAGWALITPDDQGHPLQSGARARSWLMVHPCHTRQVMQLLLEGQQGHVLLPVGMTSHSSCSHALNCCQKHGVSLAHSADDGETPDLDALLASGHVSIGVQGGHQSTSSVQPAQVDASVFDTKQPVPSMCHDNSVAAAVKYLAFWFAAVVGPVVGLRLNTEQLQTLCNHHTPKLTA